MRSSGMPALGTSRFSMPCAVPSQLTLQPRRLHLVRDREAGDDVAAGARGHDDEVAHCRPRIALALAAERRGEAGCMRAAGPHPRRPPAAGAGAMP